MIVVVVVVMVVVMGVVGVVVCGGVGVVMVVAPADVREGWLGVRGRRESGHLYSPVILLTVAISK